MRRYEGCYYTRLESYYIIFYFETDWSRIRPLPSTTLKKTFLKMKEYVGISKPKKVTETLNYLVTLHNIYINVE